MKLLVVGDIGTAGMFHSGDEAMAEAAVAEVAARADVEVAALGADPDTVRERYGWRAVPCLGFAPTDRRSDLDAHLDAVTAAAEGDVGALRWSDPAWHGVQAIASSDAVLVCGGGNLNSTWPVHIYTRAAVARVARVFGRPLVVTGQTIGPHLTGRDGELVGELLTSAVLVGVRERASRALCARLGVLDHKISTTVDDAGYLSTGLRHEWDVPTEPYVAATFARHPGDLSRDDYVAALARLVTHAHAVTGLTVLLVPHDASLTPGVRDGDVALHDEVREVAGGSGIVSLPMCPGAEAIAAQRAAAVISTRYHPVVFGLAASVPSLGVGTDAYTSTKIWGAMDNMGVGPFGLSGPALVGDGSQVAFTELWERRAEVSAVLTGVNRVRREESAAWWDAVTAGLRGDEPDAPTDISVVAQLPVGRWSDADSRLGRWANDLSSRETATRIVAEQARRQVLEAREQVEGLLLRAASLESDLDAATEHADLLRRSAEATTALVAADLDRVVRAAAALPAREAELEVARAGLAAAQRQLASVQSELDATRATRVFRWSALPRGAWSRIRRRLSGGIPA